MTDERKNEIWAILPSDYQTYVRRWYEDVIDNNEQHEHIFEGLFGTHNLTAQAEEKPKAASMKSDDGKIVIPIKAEYDDSVYAAYRLDLAKEIAVAMIGKWSNADFIPDDSVRMTNEIVKRLKETEE